MKKKVFIDGSEGTTGLQIAARLQAHSMIELLSLKDELRKDKAARIEKINQADLAVLCLPDEAALEIVSEIKAVKSDTKILDSSTAHRTNDDWVYGMKELSPQWLEKISSAQFVSNPGCFAIGSIALLRPLIESEIIDKNSMISIFSISGYSGGGKKMIADYEGGKMPVLDAYSLNTAHKHLPETIKYSKLSTAPAFLTNVGSFRQGILVMITLKCDCPDKVREVYKTTYNDCADISLSAKTPARIDAASFAGRDDMELYIFADKTNLKLCALFDNLGKGAAGNAVSNINLMLNFNQ